MLENIFKYEFLQNALITAILISVICGIVGVVLTEKKLLILSGGIAHTAYGGVGLGYLFGFTPILGAGFFAVISALILGTVRRKKHSNTETVISLLWSLGMALGIAFIGLMPSFPPDINSYLFGNILSVSKGDILFMLGLTLVTLLVFLIFFNDWKAYLYDSEFAKIIGIKTSVLEYTLLILTALSIVILIRAVGIILVIALFSAPAATASLFTKKLKRRMLLASVFCLIFCLIGLTVSYYLSIPSGAAIVFVAVVFYFFMRLFKAVYKQVRYSPH